jgi:hypothetical protein
MAHVFYQLDKIVWNIKKLNTIRYKCKLNRISEEEPVIIDKIRSHNLLPVLNILINKFTQSIQYQRLAHQSQEYYVEYLKEKVFTHNSNLPLRFGLMSF